MAAGETVTVACKLPNGIKLRIFDMVKKDMPVMGGGMREVPEAVEVQGQSFIINGNTHPQNAAPRCLIVGGFALTSNVPKELWDRWLEQNKESDIVRNGLIFAHAKDQDASARAQAKERAALRSGLERLDPEHLPQGIKTADKAQQAA